MVCGFFGVVISLERAVAIGRAWAYGAPLLAGLSSATAALRSAASLTPWLAFGASAVLVVASLDVLRRQRTGFNAVIALAAGCWLAGCVRWGAGAQVYDVVGWWVAFLVPDHRRRAAGAVALHATVARRGMVFAGIVAGVLVALAALARRLERHGCTGLALLALALWLLRPGHRACTVRQSGLTRFIASVPLNSPAYFWLGVGGVLIALHGLAPGSAVYDAALRAAARLRVLDGLRPHADHLPRRCCAWTSYHHPVFYAPLALLHASLLLRGRRRRRGSIMAGRAGAGCCRRWRCWRSSPTPRPRCCASGAPRHMMT